MAVKRTPSWLGDENAAHALASMIDGGPLSRNGIAARINLSKQTAAQIVARLEERGLIIAAGEEAASRGPAATVYGVRKDVVFGVGVNVDQHGVQSSVVDVTGRAHVVARQSAEGIGTDRSAAKDVAHAVLSACRSAGVDLARVGHVCIGVPSSVDTRTDELSSVEGLPGWSRQHVRRQIEEALGCSVRIDNDVNLAAVAERSSGAYDDGDITALIWIGHGIGLALDIAGKVVHGSSGGAGEIGHLPVSRTVVPGVTENLDIEDTVGAGALEALARSVGEDRVTFEGILAGEDLPPRVSEALAPRLAHAVIPVLGVIDPDHVVFGGPVGRAGGAALAELTRVAIRDHTRWDPPIEVARVGADPVLSGALELLRRDLREDVLARARRSEAEDEEVRIERSLRAIR
ncbi:ROK family transcriptional regulator [Microbacterium resistens]|uniref:ROK family transcriptional regulator n=1 Tax=Microbacterium resistens TaxID=156977 RepID=UPI0008365A2A|nr:ROK family transcriptional regulator [Microbacterium resistens]MBW1640796.1 ROK family transcriptional regulator [Microbacterium resistens]